MSGQGILWCGFNIGIIPSEIKPFILDSIETISSSEMRLFRLYRKSESVDNS